MKRLVLVRHAKSGQNQTAISDFERPLNHRGERNAPVMALRLLQRDILPDKILSSSANRAKSTALVFAKELDFHKRSIEYLDHLYLADCKTLFETVSQTEDEVETLILFAHNPGITDFVNYLSHEHIANVPTCGVVGLLFQLESWKDLKGETGHLEFFDYPKDPFMSKYEKAS